MEFLEDQIGKAKELGLNCLRCHIKVADPRGISDHRRQWDGFVDTFATRARWTFSPNGDAVRTLSEPLIVSEFGNWGLPDIDLLSDHLGRDPWWFETGAEWTDGVVYPHNVRQRYHKLGLDRVFGSWKAFIEATQQQQFLALKYQIEAMRRRPEPGCLRGIEQLRVPGPHRDDGLPGIPAWQSIPGGGHRASQQLGAFHCLAMAHPALEGSYSPGFGQFQAYSG